MATLILRPDAPGDVCTIGAENGAACPNHYLNVDEVVPDEDTTCVLESVVMGGSFNTYDLYHLPNHTVETGTINWVKVWIRVRVEVAGISNSDCYTKIKTLGVEYTGGAVGAVAYANYSTQYNNHPAGGAWTWAQVDGLQAGVRLDGDSGEEKGDFASAVCTQVWVEIDYTPPAPPGGGAVSANMGSKMVGAGLL